MFVYIQSLLIMMLEILCCKIFFEAFGIKREVLYEALERVSIHSFRRRRY